MHKARAFFFVCAGLFLLVLAYHLGAQSARAQSGGSIECAALDNTTAAAVIGGHYYRQTRTQGVFSVASPVPGPVAACGCNLNVLLQDGRFFESQDGLGWTQVGALPASPVPTSQQTWGSVKAKYATPR